MQIQPSYWSQIKSRSRQIGERLARHVGGVSGIARVALETMRTTYQELPGMSENAARGAHCSRVPA